MGKTKANRSFISNFLVLGTGSFIYLIIGVIGTPVLTRLVDPVDYGYMSIFTVYSSIGFMFLGLGLDQALVRYFYRHDETEYKRLILFECFAAPLLLGIAIGILALPVVLATDRMGLTDWPIDKVALLGLNVIALLFQRYALLVLRLQYRTKQYSTINIIQKSLYLIFAVALILIFRDYYFYILAFSMIASTMIAAVCAAVREKEVWNFRGLSRSGGVPFNELFAYSIPLMFSNGITILFNALDKLFLKHYCSWSDVGVYTSAMNIMAVFRIVQTSFNALWMPTAVEHYEKQADDKAFYQKGNAFIVILMVSFGAAVILFKDLFVMLLGQKYQGASRIIPFLMFEPIMYTISETTSTGIVVKKKSKYQLIIAIVSCLTNFVGNWILTPLMGPRGAALSTGVSYVVFFAMRTMLANKVFHVDYRMKSFTIVTLALLLFAWYGSLHYFNAAQILMFAAVIGLTALCYRDYLTEALQYAGKLIKRKIGRKA